MTKQEADAIMNLNQLRTVLSSYYTESLEAGIQAIVESTQTCANCKHARQYGDMYRCYNPEIDLRSTVVGTFGCRKWSDYD